jgi:hypothetical protein
VEMRDCGSLLFCGGLVVTTVPVGGFFAGGMEVSVLYQVNGLCNFDNIFYSMALAIIKKMQLSIKRRHRLWRHEL